MLRRVTLAGAAQEESSSREGEGAGRKALEASEALDSLEVLEALEACDTAGGRRSSKWGRQEHTDVRL